MKSMDKNHLLVNFLIYIIMEIKNGKTLKDGIGHGLYTEWYENGQKKSKGTLKNGNRDGLKTWWYENGQKKTKGNYKDNEKDGLDFWYENGQKQQEERLGKLVKKLVLQKNGIKMVI